MRCSVLGDLEAFVDLLHFVRVDFVERQVEAEVVDSAAVPEEAGVQVKGRFQIILSEDFCESDVLTAAVVVAEGYVFHVLVLSDLISEIIIHYAVEDVNNVSAFPFVKFLGGGNQHSAYRVSEGDDDYPQERVGCDFSGEEEVEHIGDAVLEAAGEDGEQTEAEEECSGEFGVAREEDGSAECDADSGEYGGDEYVDELFQMWAPFALRM